MTRRRRASRWGGAAAGVVVGGVVGLTGAFVQAQRVVVGPTSIPWGVVAVWVVLVVVIRGCAWAAGTRWAAWAAMLGWLAVTVVLTAEGPAGDVIISGGARQLTYLLGGVVIASAAATLPLPRH